MFVHEALPRALGNFGRFGISPRLGVGFLQEKITYEAGLYGNMIDGLFTARFKRECPIKGAKLGHQPARVFEAAVTDLSWRHGAPRSEEPVISFLRLIRRVFRAIAEHSVSDFGRELFDFGSPSLARALHK